MRFSKLILYGKNQNLALLHVVVYCNCSPISPMFGHNNKQNDTKLIDICYDDMHQ